MASGAGPENDSRDWRLAGGIADFAGLDQHQLTELRGSVLRGRDDSRNLIAAAVDVTRPIEARLDGGWILPPALAALVEDVGPASSGPLAREVYTRAAQPGEDELYRQLLGTSPASVDPAGGAVA
ncbi:hypothetical protein GCM10009557_63660 [Virgisporangium ochraceum]|uniref:Uncharacterized protein n=1 Tax=Virgisporangium ochraceum TaxID=65505 RepID=A0A8J4EFR1_9ACTN|nr:hypothetical protein [Virgisporangium ochraceum]GIJ72913.1 hypothetical protein Voc01_078300 [Virgisporangium ochraceum]